MPTLCRSLLLLIGAGAALLAPLPGQSPLTAAQVATIAQSAHERFGAIGLALAVVQDGEVLAEVAFGERAPGLPMTPATQCNIASCTKAFTAAAIALLVQDGKLGWDDLVVEHVPEFRLSDPWITAHMTVRDLLSHRCGLVTFAGDLLWYGSDHDDAEVLRRAAKLPIRQRFREQYGYQNLMYAVAGTIIARRSGTSWEQFVESRLFAPLGMVASRASAQRLTHDAEKALPFLDRQPIVDHEFVACRPAASIYSSVHELTAWMRMLLAGGTWQQQRVLHDTSLRELWRPHVSTAPRGSAASTADLRSYGLGWFLSLERGHKLVEHDGGMPGFLSKVSLLPAEGFGFVVLNNSNDGVLNEAVKRALLAQRSGGDGMQELERLRAVKDRIAERDRKEQQARMEQRRPDTKPTLPLSDYAGSYVDECYGEATVAVAGEQLTLVLVPSQRRLHGTLLHWHLDTFRIDWPDRFLPFGLVRFELDHAGRVAGFRIDCPIADFDFAALDFRRQPPPAGR